MDCKHFQVSVGTTMLTPDEQQFDALTKTALQKKELHVCMPDAACKCIILPTPTHTVHIVLSQRALLHLHEMTQAVDIDIKTNLLIGLFSGQD